MGAWKEYALSIIVCALICSIASSLVTGSRRKKLMQLVRGAALTVTVLLPISDTDLHAVPDFLSDYRFSAQDYVHAGEQEAKMEQERYIKEACAAYISNKAAGLGAEVSARIYLDEEYTPVYAQLQGCFDSHTEEELALILEKDLGITKENQVWNWRKENNSS